MFRVVAYYNDGSYRADQSIRFTSAKLDNEGDANTILDMLVSSPMFQGGHLETFVDGIGWILNEEN